MFYKHTTRDKTGRTLTETSEAESVSALTESLRADGRIVLAIKPVKKKSGGTQTLPPRWHPAWLLRITSLDIEFGMTQIASMLRGGVSITLALQTAAEQSRRPRAAKLWLSVYDEIRRGHTLSSAMARLPAFGEYVTQLVRIGEFSGELDNAFTRAAEHLERRRSLHMMVVNALVYPCFAIAMALGVSAFLIMNVIPKIEVFLRSSGAELPEITRLLLELSAWLNLHWIALVVGIGIALIAIFLLRKIPLVRDYSDAFLLRMPVSGRVLKMAGTATVARGLSILIESGVTLLDSLNIVRNLTANRRLSRRIAEARDCVINGEPLASSLGRAKEFPPMLSKMTAVAESTGTLGPTLAEVSRFHEEMLVIVIKRLSSTIEPVMVVITAGIIGFVYIAFFSALFSMASMG